VNILRVEKIISNGCGLGYIKGKAHFIKGALQGELVSVQIIESKNGYNICSIDKIIEKSSKRIEPFCKYYGICGGCSIQNISYLDEIEIKKEIIKDIFKRIAQMELLNINSIYSLDKGYRNRVQLQVYNGKIGFNQEMSNKIVNIDNCPLLYKGLNVFLQSKPILKNGRHNVFSWDGGTYIGGVDNEARVTIMEKQIFFDPQAFFQSNLNLLPKLIDLVVKNIIGKNVMDLYCGVGLFSIFLNESLNITSVELDSRVAYFVKKNLGNKAKFFNMSLEDYIKNQKEENSIDTIIVDPPRIGLSGEVKKSLLSKKAKRIIYVSCDLATMARDIKDLKSIYSLTSYYFFDFYPHTTHIESLGILDLD
jgi:23S rRNA (uracil1939-C5)-methyltransferase